MLHFKASKRLQWHKSETFTKLFAILQFDQTAWIGLPVDRRELQVALLPPELLMTWATPTKSPYYFTLPPHSKSDRTNNNLLATLFWPIRAPEHNTMTKWLLPLPPNTHITCTAAAISDPLDILLLWNCKTGEEEHWSLLHRKLFISLLIWICALRKGTTQTFTQSLQPYHPTKMFLFVICNKTMSTILFWEHQLECHC